MTASKDASPVTWPVHRVSTHDPSIEELWASATAGVRQRRGGRRYLDDLLEGDSDSSLASFIAGAMVWSADAYAFTIVRDRVIVALYVRTDYRRMGIGRTLVRVAIAEADARDALVLPGDRAMKSLFESIGWKARLLTLGDG